MPVWLIFSTFWADLAYANVYVIMALLATLLIEAVLKHRLGWSILWLGLIIQIKPQWAFAIFIPLCLREWKFLFKLLAGAGLLYLACMGASMLAVGSGFICFTIPGIFPIYELVEFLFPMDQTALPGLQPFGFADAHPFYSLALFSIDGW